MKSLHTKRLGMKNLREKLEQHNRFTGAYEEVSPLDKAVSC